MESRAPAILWSPTRLATYAAATGIGVAAVGAAAAAAAVAATTSCCLAESDSRQLQYHHGEGLIRALWGDNASWESVRHDRDGYFLQCVF